MDEVIVYIHNAKPVLQAEHGVRTHGCFLQGEPVALWDMIGEWLKPSSKSQHTLVSGLRFR